MLAWRLLGLRRFAFAWLHCGCFSVDNRRCVVGPSRFRVMRRLSRLIHPMVRAGDVFVFACRRCRLLLRDRLSLGCILDLVRRFLGAGLTLVERLDRRRIRVAMVYRCL